MSVFEGEKPSLNKSHNYYHTMKYGTKTDNKYPNPRLDLFGPAVLTTVFPVQRR